jgi:hypothetical protein
LLNILLSLAAQVVVVQVALMVVAAAQVDLELHLGLLFLPVLHLQSPLAAAVRLAQMA